MRAGGRSLKRGFQASGLDEIKGESKEKGGEGRRAAGRPQRPELLQAFDWSGEGGAMEMRGADSGRGGSLGGTSVTWGWGAGTCRAAVSATPVLWGQERRLLQPADAWPEAEIVRQVWEGK